MFLLKNNKDVPFNSDDFKIGALEQKEITDQELEKLLEKKVVRELAKVQYITITKKQESSVPTKKTKEKEK